MVEQTGLLEQRYLGRPPSRRLLAVSTQDYSFVVDAFVRMVKAAAAAEYAFALRETRTWDIIEDVRTLRSELGVLYRNDFNRNVIDKLLRESGSASRRCSSPPRTSSSLDRTRLPSASRSPSTISRTCPDSRSTRARTTRSTSRRRSSRPDHRRRTSG